MLDHTRGEDPTNRNKNWVLLGFERTRTRSKGETLLECLFFYLLIISSKPAPVGFGSSFSRDYAESAPRTAAAVMEQVFFFVISFYFF